MNVQIRDAAAMRAIQPMDAALYLRIHWTELHTEAGRSSTWTRTVNGEEFEVLLPLNSDIPDYALRIGDLLGVVAAAERRSQWDVYNDLLTITSDVIRIRIADAELRDGSLPIEEHAQIAQKARDLVLAAACATTEKRAVWHKRKPGQAMEHVRRVRIGQSERGSYVVTVLSRITPELHGASSQLFEPAAPYDRRVTLTLAHSLLALAGASEQAALTQNMAAFDDAVARGVNSNLCDAVAGLWGGDEVQRNLEFSFSWSPTRPVASDEIKRVAFSSDRVPLIREAARLMWERAPSPDFELSGPVVRLERAEGAAIGKVTVVGIVDERQARVTAEMGDPGYQVAVKSHARGQTVVLSGTLMREGRGYVLRNPTGITIEQEHEGS
jgi:hypothetical protein